MIFTTGYDWLDCLYFIIVLASSALFAFKPWKTKTKEEIKEGRKVIRYHRKTGYVTKSLQSFEAKYWLFGFIVAFLMFILPWLFVALNWGVSIK